MNTCIYILYKHMYTYIHVYIYICIDIFIQIKVCKDICIYVYICIYICIQKQYIHMLFENNMATWPCFLVSNLERIYRWRDCGRFPWLALRISQMPWAARARERIRPTYTYIRTYICSEYICCERVPPTYAYIFLRIPLTYTYIHV